MASVCSATDPQFSKLARVVVILLVSVCFTSTEASNKMVTKGNITVKWDLMAWTPDGYVATVSIFNFQHHRPIKSPGWKLGWTWSGREVIWSMVGAESTKQGDCSRFKGSIPHSCQRDPLIVDLLPNAPYNQQVANCCKGGVLSSWDQDRSNSLSMFQIAIGAAGNTPKTVRLPVKFTIQAPGKGYGCRPAKVVKPSTFRTADGKRVTRAYMTWDVICMLGWRSQ